MAVSFATIMASPPRAIRRETACLGVGRLPAGREAFVQWVRTPAERRDTAAAARSAQATESLLALLEAHLATHAYMCGDRLTMADIPIGCELHRWFGLPADLYTRPAWPNLERYFAALRDRPAARGVLDQPLE